MTRDTRVYCRGCLTCHRAKPTNIGKEPVQEMDISKSIPGYAVGIDVGTLTWAEGGYRYFLLLVVGTVNILNYGLCLHPKIIEIFS